MTDIEFYRLAGKYVDGTASDEDAARLLDRVQSDPESRLALARLLYHERSLAKAFAAMESARAKPAKALARRSVWIGRGWLAAAAAALVVFGALHFAPWPDRATGARLVLALGDVQVSGNVYSTGPDSYARLEYADGSAVLLGQATRAAVSAARADDGKQVRLFDGELYLSAIQQKKPLAVQCGDTALTVLGTRFHVRSEGGVFHEALLLDGSTRVSNAVASVVLRAGQRVRAFIAPYDGTSPLLEVETIGSQAPALDWLDALGENSAALWADMARHTEHWAVPTLSYDRYTVAYGHWSMRRENGEVILRKNNTGRGLLLFGTPRWTRGRIEGRLRFLTPDTVPGMRVSLGFYYRDPADEPPADDKADLWHDGPFDYFGPHYEEGAPSFGGAWIRMRKNFEIGRRNDLTIREVHFVSERDPKLAFSALTGTTAGFSTPQNTRIQSRSKAGILIRADGAAMEFASLRVADGRPVPAPPKEPTAGRFLFQDDFEQGLQSHWIPLQREWKALDGAGSNGGRGLSVRTPPFGNTAPVPACIALNQPIQSKHFEVAWDVHHDARGEFIMRIEFFDSLDPLMQAVSEDIEVKPPVFGRAGQWLRITCRVRGDICTVFTDGREQSAYRINGPFRYIALVAQSKNEAATFRFDNLTVRALPTQDD